MTTDLTRDPAPASARDCTPADSLVLRTGTLSWLFPRRTALVVLGLTAVAAVVVVLASFASSTGMSPGDTLAGLLGTGTRGQVLLVREFRLPRILVGLMVGAALGVSGCLTQTLAGNRLATPDVIGVNEGASAAVVASVVGSSTAMVGEWWLGPLGAAAAAVLVVLAAGGTGTRGYRVLVVGIGVSTVIGAVTDLVMSRQNQNTAGGVFLWSVGSLNGRDFSVGAPLLACLTVLIPLALIAGRRLDVMRFDDDMAASLGLNIPLMRGLTLALAVALAGVAVGIGGPIAFVALAAPVVAGRLCGPTRVPVIGSALTGAILIGAADALGRIVAPVEIPVGVVTSVLGGPFLLWVLFSDGAERPRYSQRRPALFRRKREV
ncbi:FecCD family ABC transporter permease [Streptomyces sp. H39-S7]|uniref:FecCD family ABC transporter permease n=1 Tax=Streptomyces sp. H39-S7 TaxID=3004357 RepID=UPI0022AFED59|nr:iron ABC transporter permease [Streptomyces sp. H39-S7]MCZ4123084.1 iron ABC transporter permease [Streptomyces sp. H39-S7]